MAKHEKEQQTAQAIAVINNLIIPDSVKYKLKVIAKKIYQSTNLTNEEKSFWNSFPNSEKSYILTGDTASTLDFTEYQHSTFCKAQQEVQQPEEVGPWEDQNFFEEPTSSDTDSSEDPDYVPSTPVTRVIEHTDDSWPDNSNSNLIYQPSTSNQLPKVQRDQNLDSNSSTESSDSDISPGKLASKSKTSSSFVDSWKNTAQALWKPPSKLKVLPDPSAISTRTRSKIVQDDPVHMVSHPHDLNIDSVCCNNNRQKQTKPSGGFQKNWELCHQCSLPSHPYSGEFDENSKHSNRGNGTHKSVHQRCL
jgi:hypothetical protein